MRADGPVFLWITALISGTTLVPILRLKSFFIHIFKTTLYCWTLYPLTHRSWGSKPHLPAKCSPGPRRALQQTQTSLPPLTMCAFGAGRFLLAVTELAVSYLESGNPSHFLEGKKRENLSLTFFDLILYVFFRAAPLTQPWERFVKL